ncbi:unnamed protein product [Rhizoctonia solani]|uniref:F-box domain-containing protein n=1 Tax=Rhizoctonia solani TaxID=456999 RepID=A0A8H3A2I7_9AGAM|nr:unnamed protein product [Rhizoctonia solani]
MIDQLKAAGDQLRVAWDNYFRLYSGIQNYPILSTPPYAQKFPPELARQLDVELTFISSYEPKIREIRLGISRARNYWSGLAPINALSMDVLMLVFHYLRPQSCNVHYLDSSDRRYPDYLTQVCALWRRIALSSRSLWSHIDISPYGPSCGGLIARAEAHAIRSGDFPIDLHIPQGAAGSPVRENRSYYALYEHISRISNRIGSFEFDISGDFRGFHRSVLSRLLLSRPPSLTKLVINSRYNHYNAFIYSADFEPGESDEEFEDFRLDLTEDEIENGFAALRVLRLQGVFPSWSSIAFRGLVDLRLLSTDSWSSIEEEELAIVLDASPGLQIFHFGLEIQDSMLEIAPTHLEDLRVVKIFPYKSGITLLCPSSLLRLLAPGSEPLRLSFDNYYEPDTNFTVEFERFFARSTVTHFYTRGAFLPLSILLHHAKNLEQAILEDFEPATFGEIPSSWLDLPESPPLYLKSIYVTASTLSESGLRLLVKSCPIGIILCSCDVELDNNEESMGEEVSDLFPTVRVTNTPLYPQGDLTADWDILA